MEADLLEHRRVAQLGYALINETGAQTLSSRSFGDPPVETPKDTWVDVMVIDYMKTYDVPQLVVKEVTFKDQLAVNLLQLIVYHCISDCFRVCINSGSLL